MDGSSKRPRIGIKPDDDDEDYDQPLAAPKLTPPPPAMRYMGGARKQPSPEQMKPVRLTPRETTAMNFYRPASEEEEEEELTEQR